MSDDGTIVVNGWVVLCAAYCCLRGMLSTVVDIATFFEAVREVFWR